MSDVKSARRVLGILHFFAQERAPASLARIAGAMELPKSSCLALLETLVGEGYAYQADGRYYLTARWLRESEVVTQHDLIAPRCRAALEALGKEVDETVILAQLSHDKVTYLDTIEADHVLRFAASVGQRKPLHAAASGRALLALLPDADRRRIAESLAYDSFTPSTTTSASTLLALIDDGIQRGWHVNHGEYQAGTVSVAAAALLDGTPVAMVVGAPATRVEHRIDEIGAAVRRAANALAAAH